MKKVLLTMVALLAFGGWFTETKAAWVIKGDPITNSSALMSRLQETDGRALFVMEPVSQSAYRGYYFLTTGGLAQYQFISDNQVIEIIDANSTGSLNQPEVYLRSYASGNYWAATAVDASDADLGGFTYTESQAFEVQILNASEYSPTDAEGNNYSADYDALLFCGMVDEANMDDLGQWSWIANNGSSGIGYWTGGTMQEYTQFYVWEVEDIESALQDLTILCEEYEAEQGSYVAGEGMGYCDSAAVEAFQLALQAAQDLLADPTATDEQMNAAGEVLKAAFDAMAASFVRPKDGGIYYVISTLPAFYEQQGVLKAWYKGTSTVAWKSIDRNDISFLFQFIEQPDGTFAIQSLKDNTYLSTLTGGVTTSISNTQSIWPACGGGFYIVNGASESSGSTDVYHAQGHSSGAGVSGALTDWYAATTLASASTWTFEEFTDMNKLDSLRALEVQRQLTSAFQTALSEARADSAAGYVTAIHNVITDASQLSTNAQEPTEGPIANLLDGDTDSFFHTEWSVSTTSDTHYLQASLTEPLQNISLYWYKRSGNNNNRPARVTILGSNDGTNFDSIMVLQDGLPSASTQPAYFSPVLDLGKPYSHIRLRVDSTNTKTIFFTMSEFAITADGFPVDQELSMGVRPDMLEVYAALKAAIDEALAKDPQTVTQADIDALNNAIAAFDAAYPDTTVLVNAINAIKGYASATATDPSIARMGYCTDAAAINAVATAVSEARAALNANPKMTRAEIDSHVATLNAAGNAFLASVILPEPNAWYYIQSTCDFENRNDEDGPLTNGTIVYPSANSNGASIIWGEDVSVGASSPKYLWKFIPVEGKDNTYNVQNIGSGYYLGQDNGKGKTFYLDDEPAEFNFIFVTDGQLSLKEAGKAGAEMIHAQEDYTVLVAWNNMNAGSPSTWTFVEANEEEQTATIDGNMNRASIHVLPYDVNGTFFAWNDDAEISEEVSAYEITGADYDESQNITAIKISPMAAEDGIPAGTPFILAIGDVTAEAGDSVSIDLGLVFNSAISTEVKPATGIVGVMSNTAVDKAGIGYFTAADNLIYLAEGASVTIAGQSGYIDGALLEGLGSEGEITIPVNGGVITDIAQAVKDANTIVTVYTVDGQLVRQNVKVSDATKGLAKGLYIIGGKVVYVK